MRFYRIQHPELWGDYERILICGMTTHLEQVDGKLQLERCGPCVPPISLCLMGDVVVTSAFRQLLESAGLAKVEFETVIKAHIVDFAWEKLDFRGDEMPYLPGEP